MANNTQQTAMERLIDLVGEFSAPKNQFNNFGKYKYRNIEAIQEAFKPLGKKYRLKMTFKETQETIWLDGVQQTAIKCKCIIKDDKGEKVDHGTGRGIIQIKKGMDLSQSTGTAQSYARKYAAGAVLNIDDTQDSDSMKPEEPKKAGCSDNEMTQIMASITAAQKDHGMTWETFIGRVQGKYPCISNNQKNELAQGWAAVLNEN